MARLLSLLSISCRCNTEAKVRMQKVRLAILLDFGQLCPEIGDCPLQLLARSKSNGNAQD